MYYNTRVQEKDSRDIEIQDVKERIIMMKGFFNGLVSARMMELEGERVCAKTLQRGKRTAR